MAETYSTEPTPEVTSAPASGESFWKRELNGASFLTLEHVAHMVLVVIVAGLLAGGIGYVITMWTGNLSALPLAALVASSPVMATGAFGMVAALLVLVPLLMLFDRRTRAEWNKREGYAGRLAYKVPVYVALGLLAAGGIAAGIGMLEVVLTSLAMIGTSGADFGSMYLNQFLPATIAAIVFGASAWYVFKLAKGNDMGKIFSGMVALVGAALAVALFVTAVVNLHNKSSDVLPGGSYSIPTPQPNTSSPSNPNYQDLFNY